MTDSLTRLSSLSLDFDEHELPLEEICAKYSTNVITGMTDLDVACSRTKYGANKLVPKKSHSVFFNFLRHISQGVSSLMIAAAIVCIMGSVAEFIGDMTSPIDEQNLFLGIFLAFFITLTAIFSYFIEKSSKNLLKSNSTSICGHEIGVVRNGEKKKVKTEDLVVGDLVELKFGDHVPADIRIISSTGFKVDSSALTGLSTPKSIKTYCSHKNPLLSQNLIFYSTYALEGKI